MIDKETQEKMRKLVEEDLRTYQFRLNVSSICALIFSLVLPLDTPFPWMILSVCISMIGINYFWVASAEAILEEDDFNEFL